ncbi:MAG: beta-galactosidase [Anaerolineae bacterium]
MLYYGCDYYPEHWPESRWVTDAQLMREAGFNVARIGEFAWAKMEPSEGEYDWAWLDRIVGILADHGIQVVLSTPTATPPPWLVKAHPEILPRDQHRQVRHAGSRRHYCPNSPVYRDYSRGIVTALARRYGHDERVIGWQTDNEFGCHDTGRCFCDTCAARFREWLRARYGSLEVLNRAWGSVFWSALYSDWEEIPLPWAAPAEHNPSHVLDFLRFGSDSMRDYQQMQIDILRAQAPDQFITHNFMLFFSRELDFYDLAAPLDFVSWDNYHSYGATPAIVAATHDLYWGMKRRGYWVMEQQVSNVNWAPYNPTFRPGELGLKVWQGVAHGADGIVYFRWRAATLGAELYHSGLLDHSGQPTRGYAEAQAIGRALPQLASLLGDTISDAAPGSTPQAEVALLHDYPSRWSLDLQPHNRDLADDAAFRRALMGPYEALWARNVAAHVLPLRPREGKSESDLSAYKIVVVPAINLLSREDAARLAAYVHGGGTLIVTARSGFKDERGQVPGQPPGYLAEILGVTVEEFDSLPPGRTNQVAFVEGPRTTVPVSLWCEVLSPTTARPLAIYQTDYYAGRAAATLRDVDTGGGRAIYVGVLAGPDFYGALFDWLLPQVGVKSLMVTPPGVEAKARIGPAGRVVFVLNHTDRPATVTLIDSYVDALTGELVPEELGLGAREVKILRAMRSHL